MVFIGRDEIVALLIKNGALVSHKRSDMSPMKAGVLWAMECERNAETFCKSLEANNVLKALIKGGANVDEKLDSNGFTLLHLATQLGMLNTNQLVRDRELQNFV